MLFERITVNIDGKWIKEAAAAEEEEGGGEGEKENSLEEMLALFLY